MNKYNRITSFRFSESTYAKLDQLKEYDKKESRRMHTKEKNQTEIVEEAIRELYYKKINKYQDADIVDRVSDLVDDKVQTSLTDLIKKVDEVLYLTIKHDIGNKVLYRSPSVLPPPKDVDQAIRILINEESGWNNALEELLSERWSKNKISFHDNGDDK